MLIYIVDTQVDKAKELFPHIFNDESYTGQNMFYRDTCMYLLEDSTVSTEDYLAMRLTFLPGEIKLLHCKEYKPCE